MGDICKIKSLMKLFQTVVKIHNYMEKIKKTLLKRVHSLHVKLCEFSGVSEEISGSPENFEMFV